MKEYSYSRLAYGKFYQLKADYEGDSIARNTTNIPFIDQAFAATGNPSIAYVAGSYN